MRIAIVNGSRNRVGGVESYLEAVLPALSARGHALVFFCERAPDAQTAHIPLPAGTPCWEAETLGEDAALAALAAWQPDAVYAHGLASPALEERALGVAPALCFAHDYRGACISGFKSHAFPRAAVCDKKFGPACLLHFLPRRCGGLNPLRMLRDYAGQQRRLRLLARYAGLAVASEHMAREFRRYGLRAQRLPLFVQEGELTEAPPSAAAPGLGADSPVRLVFLGRFERNKGGHLLLESLPLAAERLRRPVICHFAGAGRRAADWRRRAERLTVRHRDVEVRFHGWLGPAQRDVLLAQCHLLVVPSLWPEPFGLVGIEAGLRGVPAAAFAVGGIGDWLQSGINGTLAPGDPPTAAGLAEAIAEALADPGRYAALRRGARQVALRFDLERHVNQLEAMLSAVIASR